MIALIIVTIALMMTMIVIVIVMIVNMFISTIITQVYILKKWADMLMTVVDDSG